MNTTTIDQIDPISEITTSTDTSTYDPLPPPPPDVVLTVAATNNLASYQLTGSPLQKHMRAGLMSDNTNTSEALLEALEHALCTLTHSGVRSLLDEHNRYLEAKGALERQMQRLSSERLTALSDPLEHHRNTPTESERDVNGNNVIPEPLPDQPSIELLPVLIAPVAPS